MEKVKISAEAGREIEINYSGTPNTSALLFHHGTPGSALTWSSWLRDLDARGIFAIAFSRAGYGDSSRLKGRTVLSQRDDTERILKHFGIERFVSIGWSGGGPHAISDAQDPRCAGVMSIAGVAPFGDPTLNFLEGMGEENHIEFGAAIAGEDAIEKWMNENAIPFGKVTGPELISAFGGLISEPDKKVFTPEIAEEDAAAMRWGQKNGFYGWLDDDLAFVVDWEIALEKISKPVMLWQGDLDFMVPHSHAKYLAAKIPGSIMKFVEGEGHISLGENRRDEIISESLKLLNNPISS